MKKLPFIIHGISKTTIRSEKEQMFIKLLTAKVVAIASASIRCGFHCFVAILKN